MRYIVPPILAGMMMLAPTDARAATIECRAAVPKPQTGHWSWRTVDGKRCWYPGRPGIAKTQLRWPVPVPVPVPVSARAPSAGARPGPVAVPAIAAPEPAIEATSALSQSGGLSFEQRWRLR